VNGQAFKGLSAGLTVSELCALYFSRTLLESLSGTPFRDDVESAFEKLSSVLTPHMRQFLDQLPRVIITKAATKAEPGPGGNDPQQIAARALEATLHLRQATLLYYSKSSDRTKSYLVHPYRLAYAQGGLYLLAYVPEYGEVRTFATERIQDISLLEDRFRLRTRMETRDQPIYVLAVVRRDGRLGQQIKPSGSECLPITPPAGAPPPPPPPPGGPAQGAPQCPSLLAPWAISGRQMTIERLIDVLSQRVGRRVVDKTNLTGPFDLDLQWTPDQIPGSDRGLPPPPIDPNGPALFTALQDQLGLKLDSQRGPVDVLVIDEVSKPSAD